jgi:hypothetical protein
MRSMVLRHAKTSTGLVTTRENGVIIRSMLQALGRALPRHLSDYVSDNPGRKRKGVTLSTRVGDLSRTIN